jgi:hypothetical protein
MLSVKLCDSDKIMKDTENRECNTYGIFKKCIQNFSWKNQNKTYTRREKRKRFSQKYTLFIIVNFDERVRE